MQFRIVANNQQALKLIADFCIQIVTNYSAMRFGLAEIIDKQLLSG